MTQESADCAFIVLKSMSASLRFHPLEVEDTVDEAYRLRLPASSSSWRPGKGRSERTLPDEFESSCFSCKCFSMVLLVLVTLASLLLSITALSVVYWKDILKNQGNQSIHEVTFIRRIAFGSCTARDSRPQPIWRQVIAKKPDAWVWLGDMSYADSPILSCHQVPHSPQCNCTRSYMRYIPDQCYSGDMDHIRAKFESQVNLIDYQAFLNFMCPGWYKGDARVPDGSNPSICSRPILGTYDDHDSGWNNGNNRLPGKMHIKNFFLDALGESPASPRRGSLNGLETSYYLTLADNNAVQVILLDERWYRDPLPCQMRRTWCEEVLKGTKQNAYAFCDDFLRDDGSLGIGSCCSRDEKLAAWCENQGGRVEDPIQRGLMPIACDPTDSVMWGMKPIALHKSEQGDELVEVTEEIYRSNQSSFWNPWLISSSPVCEVLGPGQRRWLIRELESSQAPIRLIGSGSVPFGSLGFSGGSQGQCSGDDINCYVPAQINLLHTLASSASTGCVIIITGDFHYSDIKVVLPGEGHPYSDQLKTKTLSRPVWQVMSSGMSDSTASSVDEPCVGTFREDLVGLRPLGRCAFFSRTSFSLIDLDVLKRRASIKIIDGSTGKVAVSQDGIILQLDMSLDTCLRV